MPCIVQLLHILLQNVMQTSLHCTIIHASICLCHRSMTCHCLYAFMVSCQPQSCAGSSGVKNEKIDLRIIYRKLEDQHRRGHFMCFFADLGLFRRSTPSTSSGYPPMGPVSQVYFQSLWPISPTVPQGLSGVTTGAMTPPTIDSPPCSSGGEGSALSGMSSLAQVGFLLIPCSL